MRILNGWKEIADCLKLTPRSAQRWERLGLPVRRVSDSVRSPIIADSDEIENWVRTKTARLDSLNTNTAAFRATQRETRRLVKELQETRQELAKQLHSITNQLGLRSSVFGDEPAAVPDQEVTRS
jgi:hypothetical protein